MTKRRSIFEDVTETATPPEAPRPGLIERARAPGSRPAVRLWLVILFVMVVAQILLGGLTRLTDSGLSITEWNLILGALPPMSEADWQQAYAAYQQTPEFQLQNNYMDLQAFKGIYWWEWSHRQLGRAIGLVWAVGFVALWLRRRLPPGWGRKGLVLGLLIGLQGALGWWMVASGLTGRMVDVASYRLALHLGLAFVLLGLMTWDILQLGMDEAARMSARRGAEQGLARLAGVLMAVVFVQILLGALVAGIDAGRSFVDWPWMQGRFIPPEPFGLSPWWANFFENAGLVQFIHRITGYLAGLLALLAWWRAQRSPNPASRSAFTWVAMMALIQVALGIITVLYAAPLHAALTHQLGAIALWVLIIMARHQARYPVTTSLRG